jgi:hypothetical protein
MRFIAEEDSGKRGDSFTIDPVEVIVVGKAIEVLRSLPKGIGSGELWEQVRSALPESCCR